jgi:adenosylhomocysteine nucleosidase
MAPVVVLIAANAEWRVVRAFYRGVSIRQAPYGECFTTALEGREVIFLHGGWGKIAAAASTQYALSTWSPDVIINLGTCGGFEGLPAGVIARGDILLVERTLVYDIIEQMTDPEAALRHYAVDLDLSWLHEPYPQPVRRGLLLSADRDILPEDIPMLVQRWGAAAADWESGAIAWVAARNNARLLILRGVSDLVGVGGGEAYGAVEIFQDGARRVMEPMLQALPGWLRCIR